MNIAKKACYVVLIYKTTVFANRSQCGDQRVVLARSIDGNIDAMLLSVSVEHTVRYGTRSRSKKFIAAVITDRLR